jgi:hypothetical protein
VGEPRFPTKKRKKKVVKKKLKKKSGESVEEKKRKGSRMMSVRVSSSLNAGLSVLLDNVRMSTIKACAEHYKFSSTEALTEMGLNISLGVKKEKVVKEREEKREKPEVPLPFTGVIQEDCCHGLKQNHGLLTQCHKKPTESGDYCQGCQKQADKNASGKPNSGSIEDRLAAFEAGKEYRDPKGKAPVAYAKVMQKLKLTEEQVQAEATKQNIELPAEIFNAAIAKRGRPKKNQAVTSDTESEASTPKQRGRPKKAGKPVEVSTTEDLFATLISEAKANSPRAEPVAAPPVVEKKEKKEPKKKVAAVKEPEPEPEPEKESEVKVKKFEFKGKMYYRTADNVLYDPKTQECMGVFNEERQEIDECEEEEEEEEDDE